MLNWGKSLLLPLLVTRGPDKFVPNWGNLEMFFLEFFILFYFLLFMTKQHVV